jgi:hypothetical protein
VEIGALRAGRSASAQCDDSFVTDLVLIHSTGQGAAGWERLVRVHARAGWAAHAVELPNDPDLLAGDYAKLIRRQVGAIAAPIVLAHSASGLLLPETARVLNARHQIWLAAWVPDPNATFVEEVDTHAHDAFNPDWIGKDPIADDAVASTFLFHDCDQPTLEWALATRRLFPATRGLRRAHLARSRDPIDVHRRDGRPHDPTRVATADGVRTPRASIRSRSRAAIARTSHSPTGWRRSSSTLPNAPRVDCLGLKSCRLRDGEEFG